MQMCNHHHLAWGTSPRKLLQDPPPPCSHAVLPRIPMPLFSSQKLLLSTPRGRRGSLPSSVLISSQGSGCSQRHGVTPLAQPSWVLHEGVASREAPFAHGGWWVPLAHRQLPASRGRLALLPLLVDPLPQSSPALSVRGGCSESAQSLERRVRRSGLSGS